MKKPSKYYPLYWQLLDDIKKINENYEKQHFSASLLDMQSAVDILDKLVDLVYNQRLIIKHEYHKA